MISRQGSGLGLLTALALTLTAVPCAAQTLPPDEAEDEAERAPAAATLDAFASTDADRTTVVRSGLNLDWSHPGEDRYQGVRVEKAWFTPLGQNTTDRSMPRHFPASRTVPLMPASSPPSPGAATRTW